MDRPIVVVVTDLDDFHADLVITGLEERGLQPVRINYSSLPGNVQVSMQFGSENSQSIRISDSGRTIEPHQVRSVWWRKPTQFRFPREYPLRQQVFGHEELSAFLGGVWNLLTCFWMSHPATMIEASRKIEQLRRAQLFGFEIPRTLVTTEGPALRNFVKSSTSGVIYKVLTDPFLAQWRFTHREEDGSVEYTDPLRQTKTTVVDEDTVDVFEAEEQVVPCLFQEYVPKSVEYRITVVEHQAFAVEIHSQDRPETQIDWRNYDADIPYEPANLPPQLERACIEFVRSYGLSFGAIDLIGTPDGRYVFLENNPGGQFLFVERLVPEHKMTDAVIASLGKPREYRLVN